MYGMFLFSKSTQGDVIQINYTKKFKDNNYDDFEYIHDQITADIFYDGINENVKNLW